MPKLYATDPRRLGYVCDDYDMPVRDLLTDKCYPNYCMAEAAGVKNWDYECNIDIRFPAPIDEVQAAPPATFVYGGGDDGSGWSGGSSWIGGSPWRSRRPGVPPRTGGGGSTTTGPDGSSTSPPSGGGRTPGRTVDWRHRPARTLVGGGGSSTSSGGSDPGSGPGVMLIGDRTQAGGTLATTGKRIRTNPDEGGGPALVGDRSQAGSTLATTGGSRFHANPSSGGGGATLVGGSTPGGGSTLSQAMQLMPQLQHAAPMRGETTQYHATPQYSTAVTARRDDRRYQATAQPAQYARTMSSGKATLSASQRSGLTSSSRDGGGHISRAMHGLGDFTTQTLPGAMLLFGGALIVGSYLATR